MFKARHGKKLSVFSGQWAKKVVSRQSSVDRKNKLAVGSRQLAGKTSRQLTVGRKNESSVGSGQLAGKTSGQGAKKVVSWQLAVVRKNEWAVGRKTSGQFEN